MRQGRLFVLLAAVTVAAALMPARAGAAPAVPGELLVRFDPGVGPDGRIAARGRADVRFARRLPVEGLELVRLGPGEVTAAARARLEREAGVLYVEPNYVRRFTVTPSDTYFGLLWGLHNAGQTVNGTTGIADADVDAPEAWDLSSGSSAAVVAIADTGVERTHPDLAPQMWANPGETGSGKETNGRDDDRNGYVDDHRGWDWIGSDNDPADEHGHGTHVAGTVAARGDNARGVAGVSWQARLMALRVLDANGEGPLSDLLDAYEYAARAGAQIVNLSLGAPGFSAAEYDALRSLSGTLFVAAAGNAGASNEVQPEYPCSYDLANIVCVAASDQRDGLASFSNYGSTRVDLAAPGTNIASTWPGGGYAYLNGTSMATPHVSGAAALAYSYFPQPSVRVVRDALLAGVDRKQAFVGKTVTGGRLNARQTLGAPAAADPPPAAPPPAPVSRADTEPPSVVLTVTRAKRIRTVLRRGLRAVVGCSEACTVRAEVLVGRRTARRLGIVTRSSRKQIGTAYVRLASAGSRKVAVHLGRRAARRLHRLRAYRVKLRVRAADLAGNRRAVARAVRLR